MHGGHEGDKAGILNIRYTLLCKVKKGYLTYLYTCEALPYYRASEGGTERKGKEAGHGGKEATMRRM